MSSCTVDLDQSRSFAYGIVDYNPAKEVAIRQVTSSLIVIYIPSFEISNTKPHGSLKSLGKDV